MGTSNLITPAMRRAWMKGEEQDWTPPARIEHPEPCACGSGAPADIATYGDPICIVCLFEMDKESRIP